MDILADERSYPTPFANSPLLPLLLLSLASQKHSPDTSKTINTEYDYIIVGAGSAGSVVASRLSELPCVSVLLLEAGRPPPLLTDVPAIGRYFWNTDIDWQYRTVPQRYSGFGLNNSQVVWPSGKTLGGSSILNAEVLVRGNRKNYDRWAAEGAKGWSYKDVLPYFKKLEDNRDPEFVANGYHGVGGPTTVHRPRYESEMKGPLYETIKSLGYKFVDSNAARQTGFYDFQSTLRAGQRCSTAKSYLVPAENRRNLDIFTNAMVRKVVIRNRRAVGVQFDYKGSTYELKAKREVIMSAGTTNTAQLLMLSGIGPRKELQRFKIPIVADLPVGKNMQDHVGTVANFLLNPGIPLLLQKLMDPVNIAQYIQNRTGPLTSSEFITYLAFLKNGVITPRKDFPDHQLYFAEAEIDFAVEVGMTPEVIAQVYGPYAGRAIHLCISHLLHPRSRGTVTLQSTDPYDPPLIDPNYFEDPRDIQDIVEGLKTCRRVATHPLMKQVGNEPFQTLVPKCEKYAENEDDYLTCVTKSLPITLNHQVGTARMGDPKDPRTVVDPHLRVLHVKGLRVVDASVMPIIPSANTNIPTIMIAEKASDIIKSTIECFEKDESPWDETEDYDSSEEHHHYKADPNRDTDDFDPNPENELWISELRDNAWVNNRQKVVSLPSYKEVPSTVSGNKKATYVMPWNQELFQTKTLSENLVLKTSLPGTNSAVPSQMPLNTMQLPMPHNSMKIHVPLSLIQPQTPRTPIQPQTAFNPMQLQMPLNPMQLQMPLNPMQHQMPLNPMQHQMPLNPMQHQMPLNPMQHQMPLNLMQHQMPFNCAQTQLPINTVQPQMTLNPSQIQMPMNPVQPQMILNTVQSEVSNDPPQTEFPMGPIKIFIPFREKQRLMSLVINNPSLGFALKIENILK